MTTAVPDLTAQYPETVKELYYLQRGYHENLTLENHLQKFPGDSWMTAEQFEEAKARILNQTFKDFSGSARARDHVWQRHGTPQLAEQVGLIDFSLRVLLHFRFKELGFAEDRSWNETSRLRWEAIYNDPDQTQDLPL